MPVIGARGAALMFLILFLYGGTAITPGRAQTDAGGWLRLAHFAADAAPVGLVVDGEQAGDSLQPGQIGPFVAVAAGDHAVAVVPPGAGADAAPVGPIDVTVEAGHRVTVALTGQAADSTLGLAALDETALCPMDTIANGACFILVHNVAGGPPLALIEDGQTRVDGLASGETRAVIRPAGRWDTSVMLTPDNPDAPVFEFDTDADGAGGFWEPLMVYLVGFLGVYPGEMWQDYFIAEAHYSPADIPTLLAAFGGRGLGPDPDTIYSFDTLLAALDAAGLTDTMRGDGPYTLFAPTDQAFASLPDAALDALLADPERLGDVLRYHVVQGDLSAAQLIEQGTLTTLQGADLTVSDEQDGDGVFNVNGSATVAYYDYPVANGRVYFVENAVLMPPGASNP